MTMTYTIRPLTYTIFTHREFESLMSDSHQLIANFAKANKSETMYSYHLVSFEANLERFQAELANLGEKPKMSLATADRERDNAIRGLFTLYRGFAKIQLDHLKKAHETLAPVFTKYKDITKHSNDVATTEIKSLLKTLKDTPYSTALDTLGLLPILDVIGTVQADYDRIEAQVRATKSTKEVGKTKQLRQDLTRTYDLFMRYTAASAEAYPEKLYFTQLLKDLNTIRDSKRRLAGTSKRKKKDVVEEKEEKATTN